MRIGIAADHKDQQIEHKQYIDNYGEDVHYANDPK